MRRKLKLQLGIGTAVLAQLLLTSCNPNPRSASKEAARSVVQTLTPARQAWVVALYRCAEDPLSTSDEAKQRNAWATKCFPDDADLFRNVDAPTHGVAYATAFNPKLSSTQAPLSESASCDDWVLTGLCLTQ